MAGNQWVFDLETNIFSNVVTIAKPKLQKKYKSMNFDTAFTTVEKNLDKDPVFPTIYIHEMPGLERGADLEGCGNHGQQGGLADAVFRRGGRRGCHPDSRNPL